MVSIIELNPMAELLQIHRPGVTLPTFGTSTRPSAYKNVPKTPHHRTVFQKVPTIINMEHQAQGQINRILDRVHSLDNLSVDDVIELRHISEHSLVLDKFKVSPAEYWNWLDKVGDDIRGVEYDAQNAYIVLKGCPGWMHEAATGVIYRRLFGELEDRLSAATGSLYVLTGSKNCVLDGKFGHSSKQADASLMNSEAKWPVVVLEAGISETTEKLQDDAKRWLEGSSGQTKLVILVDVQEKGRRDTSNDTWGLSEADLQPTHHQALSRYILHWYQSREIWLVGSFKLSVHLWYSDGNRQCILNEAAFSPNDLIDLTTIQDVPLRLDYLIPDGSDLDMSQPLLFPLRRLVHTLQNGFGIIESDRADLLAKKELEK